MKKKKQPLLNKIEKKRKIKKKKEKKIGKENIH
jgi:hypothetical protein